MKRKEEKRDLLDIRTGKELLIALLIGGGIVTLMGTAPWLLAGAIPVAKAIKDSRKNRGKLSYALWYAKNKRYVSSVVRSGQTQIALSEKGRRVAEMHLLKMRASKAHADRVWDKKWRLILFDISMEDHQKRNAFRHLIKRIGAVKLQQSVWLYPHDCSDEIAFLGKVFGFDSRHVRVVVADQIGGDLAFRKHFKV